MPVRGVSPAQPDRPQTPLRGGRNISRHSKEKRGHSFPSRHVASAFVIGTVLLPYCVWAGAAVLLAGTLLGYVRFAAGIHYPSDLLAGAALGIVFGLMAFI
ncbi:MAG: phosphatase PAP2 family protein [Christensenellaceae bacterium]